MSKRGMLNPSRKVNVSKGTIREFLERTRFSIFLVFFLLLSVSVCSMTWTHQDILFPRLVENQEAPVSIYAAVPFSYQDAAETAERKKEAMEKVPLYFRIPSEGLRSMDQIFSELPAELRKRLSANTGAQDYKPSENEAGRLVRNWTDQQVWAMSKIMLQPKLRKQCSDLMHNAVDQGILSLQNSRNFQRNTQIRTIDTYGRIMAAPKALRTLETPEEAAESVSGELVQHFPREERGKTKEHLETGLLPLFQLAQLVYDKEYTLSLKEKASDDAGFAEMDVECGQRLLRKGETVTKETLAILKAYAEAYQDEGKKEEERGLIFQGIRNTMIVILLIMFIAIYVYHIHPEIAQSNSKLCFIGVVEILAILLNMFSGQLFFYAEGLFSIPLKLWFLAIPLGFAPIVLAAVIGVRAALFGGIFASLIAAFSGYDPFTMVIYGMLISAVAATVTRPCRNFRELSLRGFFSMALVSLTVSILFCWHDGSLFRLGWWPLLVPLAESMITIVAVQVALFLLEYLFDVTTKMSLVLMNDYNHPLLKRLQMEALGTYQHSLNVAQIADAAAEAIGADQVKARACSLFHDVGKLAHPELFTENSGGEDNHKNFSPKHSAMIILNHVKEGMELARQYKLKRPIREAIQQHHGTDLVYYFYVRAKESGECFDEQAFRYSGPKPQSKEMAILSLADACEAASRSIEKPTHARISELVQQIFFKRLKDGQLDDCTLTFRELTLVRESIIKTLTSMLHARIAYPKSEETQDENDLFVDAERQASSKTNA